VLLRDRVSKSIIKRLVLYIIIVSVYPFALFTGHIEKRVETIYENL